MEIQNEQPETKYCQMTFPYNTANVTIKQTNLKLCNKSNTYDQNITSASHKDMLDTPANDNNADLIT